MKAIHDFNNAKASIFEFAGKDVQTSVKEYHVVIQATDPFMTFMQQLDAIHHAYQHLVHGELNNAIPVIKRYFLSDPANQIDEVENYDVSHCAKSIVGQAPLNGTKVGLWVYLLTGVSSRTLPTGLYEVKHGAYRHLWNASAYNLAANSEYQTRLLFNEYIMQLAQEGCTLKDNCIRTWLFVDNIDLNYGGVVRARNQVFFTQGLNHDTHFIASTGIGGRAKDPNILTQMDNYAIDGIKPEQVHYLYAPTHLNRTSDYGVSFERGSYIDYGDRRHVFISGTASINNKGLIVHPHDVVMQTRRMWENIEALLSEAECTYDDVAQMIVYLRDTADYAVVKQLYEERFPEKPYIIVHAPVCRSGWLVEMECMAVRSLDGNAFEPF